MERMALTGGIRTPIGSFDGDLKDAPADMMLALCFRKVLRLTGLINNRNIIDEVIAGNICSPPDAPNIARVAALRAELPHEIPARTVQRNCASGIEAITSAYEAWAAGRGSTFLVGGTENMSLVPYFVQGARFGLKMTHAYFIDGLWEGLVDPVVGQIMGRTAENIAQKYGITREEQDLFALRSHEKAYKATAEGLYGPQMIPVPIQRVFTNEDTGLDFPPNENVAMRDEGIKDPKELEKKIGNAPAIFMGDNLLQARYPKASFEKGKIVLRTPFSNKGTVTANNSCPISNGAAAMLAVDERKTEELGIKPDAYIVSYAYAGCDPAYMSEGPIYAVPKALNRVGLEMKDIDIFELNEAFAVQALACQRTLGIPDEKLNIWGGAIALGHPVGATGAYLTVKAMHILKTKNLRYAVITMCVGGGQGGCLIIENANF